MSITSIPSAWKLDNRTGAIADRDVRLYADFRQLEYPGLGTGSAQYTWAREDNLIDRGNCELPIAPMMKDETVPVTSNATLARSSDFSHTGDYSYKITKTVAAGTEGFAMLVDANSTTDMHDTIPGATYDVSLWAYVPTASGITLGEADIIVRYYDSAAWTSTTLNATALDTWQELTTTVTLPSTTTGFQVYNVCAATAADTEYYYVDDYKLTTHNIPGSHYLSSGYTEHLLLMPDTFTIQLGFIPRFAFDTASNQSIFSWYVSATQRLRILYEITSDQFWVLWQDGGTSRTLVSAQYDDGSSHRNINQKITLTAAIDLTTGDTTGSSLWLNKTQDDTAWSGNIDAKSTEFNKAQIRAYNGTAGAFDIAYVRFFSGLVATDAQVQADFKSVQNEEIFFSLDGHGTGRSRCNITKGANNRLTHYDLYKGVTSKYNYAYGANSFNFRLRNDDSAFSDDQYAAWDPANSVYNGTAAQAYMTQRFGVMLESWYSGDFDYCFIGRATEDGLTRKSKMQGSSVVSASTEDGVGDLDRAFEEYGRVLPGNMLCRQDTLMDRGGCESSTPPAMIGEITNTNVNATFVRTTAESYHGRYVYIGTKTIAAGTAATIALTDNAGAGDMHGMTAGSKYTWVARVKLPAGAMLGSEFVLAIVDSAGSTTQAATNVYASYQEISVSHTLDAGATYAYPQIQIAAAAADTELFYIDQIEFQPADESEATDHSLFHLIAKRGYRKQIQFLSNNSFENATIGNSWLVTAGGTLNRDAADGFFGSCSGELIPGAANEQAYQTVAFTGTKKLNVGETYNFSIYLKSTAAATAVENYIGIREYLASSLKDNTAVAYDLAGGEDYMKIEVSHTVTSSLSDRLQVVIGADAGDTINIDGGMLIQSDRAVNYFTVNALDGAAGVSLADLGVEILWPWFGIHTGNVDYTHPWRRMEINTTVWQNTKSVGAGTGARYCGFDENNTLINRSILDNDFSDAVPADTVTENNSDLNHVTHGGLIVRLDQIRANRLYGTGNKYEESTVERLIWTASAAGNFTDYFGDQQLSETVLDGAYWPNPDVYAEYWAEYGAIPDFPIDDELTRIVRVPIGVHDPSTANIIIQPTKKIAGGTPVPKIITSKRDRIVGIQGAKAIHKLSDTGDGDGAFEYVTAGRLSSGLDITSRSGQAQILLYNDESADKVLIDAGIVGKPVYKFSGAEGWIHDSYIDREDIAKNGERVIEFGGEDVIDGLPNGQLDRLADHIWKDFGRRKHIYICTSNGAIHDISPSVEMRIAIGGAGLTEYIDSTVEAASIRISADADKMGMTQITYREYQEAWKYDSNAAARFFARGVPIAGPSAGAVVTVASEYYTGGSTAYRISQGDTSAEDVINKAISDLNGAFGGGTVQLTGGTFKTDGVIVMKSGIHLALDANTTIEKNCNDHAIEAIGGSGTELTNVRITGGTITRNASDTDASSLVYLSYTDKSTVENVILNDAYAAGLYGNYCDGLIVTNVRVNEFGTGTGGGATYGMVFTYCENMGLTDCVIDGLSESKTTDLYGISIVESSCTFNGIQVSRLLTSGNTCGAYITSRSFATAGGTLLITDIESTGSTKTAYGILIDGMNGAIIQAVIDDIDNSGTAANSYGFYTEASLAAVDDNTITLNVTGCTGTGVLIEASSDRNVLIGRSTGNGTNFTDGGANTNTAAFDST